MHRFAGIVLCGGKSSRMGQAKAWLPFGGEFMLPRVVRLLSEVVSPIIVVSSPGQELPPLPADTVVAHDPQPDLGPLQGLAAGLRAVNGAHAAYVSSCDVPLLLPAFVRRMIDLLGDFDAAIPDVAGRLHPLAAVYQIQAAAVAERLLSTGERRLTSLSALLRTRIVPAAELADADPDFFSLRNVNTPADLAAALRDAGR
ncbi:MAG TPA: molybdenum cofactor guanylyltransferase [Gemmataceae bacterium]|nr:molybdenum cofactor guanylyltransferase [Gemmataceae bacterium]